MSEPKNSFTIYVAGNEFEAGRSVYLPCDDSLLLAEFVPQFSRGEVLDVGTGCGIQAIIAAKTAAHVLAIDVNPSALEFAKRNAEKNMVSSRMTFRLSNLFSAVPPDEKFDLIIFNPPYLPTLPREKVKGPLNDAFDGGEDGRRVIEPFLSQFGTHLNSGGDLLMLHCQLAGTEKTLSHLIDAGFHVDVLKTVSAGNEELCVIHAKKAQ